MSTSHDPIHRHHRHYATIPDAGSSPHDAERHPTLAIIEDLLQLVTSGAAAGALAPIDRPSATVSLPTVMWLRGPATHPKAARGLLPHPIAWSTHPLVRIATGDTLELTWSVRAFGQRLDGSVQLRAGAPTVVQRAATELSVVDLVSATPLVREVASLMPPAAERLRRRITDDGTLASWRLHAFFEPWLRRSLTAAHRAVSAELRVPRVLDDIALDDVLTELLVGSAGGAGLMAKAINRLATPGLQRPNVDAARYVVTTFRRDAELALRRRIDDPRWVGPALRRFAASHPELTGVELVEAYNRSSCTAERIGMDRAMRALHPSVQPIVVHVPVESMAARVHPSDDDVFLVAIRDARPSSPASVPVARAS